MPSPSPSATPDPVPSPSPSATPGPVNRSLAELTASETFATDAAVGHASYPGGGTSPQTSGRTTLSIRYDAAANSYTVTEGARTQSFRPDDLQPAATDPRGRVYGRTEGTVTDTLLLTRAGDTGPFTYRYAGAGLWRRTDTAGGVANGRLAAFTYGVRTPVADVPRTGSGSFAVTLTGQYATDTQWIGFDGAGLLRADFASGRFTTEGRIVSRIPTSDGIHFLPSYGGSFTGDGLLYIGSNGLNGNLTIRDATTWSVPLQGAFYGPDGVEIAGAFYGFSNQSRQMAGTLLGRRGTVAPVLESFARPLSPLSVQQYGSRLTYVANPDGSFRNAALDGSYQAELRYDAASGTYIQGGITYGGAQRVAAESNGRFTTYRVEVPHPNLPPTIRTIRAYTPGGSNNELVLSYASFSGEGFVSPDQRRIDQWFVYGLETGLAALPRTGTGSYTGLVYGSAVGTGDNADRFTLTGPASLAVDFAGLTFTGQMTPSALNTRTGVTSDLGTFRFAQTSFPGTAGMTSVLAADITGAPGASGRLQARFFGPSAEEVAGNFLLITPGAGTVLTGAGILVAKRP